jgi:regulatory protein
MHQETSLVEKAKAKALRLLAARPRTVAQIRDRLARDGLSEAAGEVVAWLTQLGYLDDHAYARARARSLLGPGRLGPRLAERRLLSAGVDADEARTAILAALDNCKLGKPSSGTVSAGGCLRPELALCETALARRLRGASLESLDDKEKQRIASFLVGRGFSGQVVAELVGIFADAAD